MSSRDIVERIKCGNCPEWIHVSHDFGGCGLVNQCSNLSNITLGLNTAAEDDCPLILSLEKLIHEKQDD